MGRLRKFKLPAAHHLGFALILAWVYIAYSSMLLFSSERVTEVDGYPFGFSYLIFFACNVAAFLIILICYRLIPGLLKHRTILNVAAALLIFTGTLMTSFASGHPFTGRPWLIVASAMSGIGSAWLFLMWGEVLGSLRKEYVGTLAPFSFFLAIVLYFLILSVPEPLALAATTLLPLLSTLLLLWRKRGTVQNTTVAEGSSLPSGQGAIQNKSEEQGKEPLPIKLFIGLAIYGCAFGLIRGLVSPVPSSHLEFDRVNHIMLLGGGIAAFLFATAAFLLPARFRLNRIYRVILPLATVGILLFPLLDSGKSIVAASIVMAAYVCFNILVWILLSSLAYNRGSALRYFGWGWLASHGGMLAGSQLTYLVLIQTQSSIPMSTISLIIIFALVVTTTFALNERELFKEPTAVANTSNTSNQVTADILIEERCRQLAATYGLSKRELSVLQLLAKGRSLPYIQKALYISKGTASSHTEHIYRKLKIHTRQELLDLTEGDNAG